MTARIPIVAARVSTLLLLAVPLAATAASEPLSPGRALQVMGALALVLGLIVVATWAARRVQGWRPQGNGHIRVIEGLAVGTRDKLLLIEVDDQRVLIGLSPGRMQTLANFPANDRRASFSATLAAQEQAAPA